MATLERRKFLRSSLALSALPLLGFPGKATMPVEFDPENNRFKLSLNSYSFNAPLRSGTTTLDAVVEFCAAQGFDAVDLTGYYFPGYPEVPTDE